MIEGEPTYLCSMPASENYASVAYEWAHEFMGKSMCRKCRERYEADLPGRAGSESALEQTEHYRPNEHDESG
jgi:hypothetical protein